MSSITNRNQSYNFIVDKLPEKRKLIFELIKENKQITTQEISSKYMLPINEITGRVTELKDMCLIVEIGSKDNKWTSCKNTAYEIVSSENHRIDLINKKFVDLRSAKDNLINDFNLGLSNTSKFLLQKEIDKIQKKINRLEKLQ